MPLNPEFNPSRRNFLKLSTAFAGSLALASVGVAPAFAEYPPKRSDPLGSERKEAPLPFVRGLIYRAPASMGKVIALTFDACMTEGMRESADQGVKYYNKAVIDYLRGQGVPYTVLLSALWIEKYQSEAQDLIADPLADVGLHGHSHLAWTPDCYGLPFITGDKNKIEETKTAQAIFRNVLGREASITRFPGLCGSKDDIKILNDLGLMVIDQVADNGDAFQDNPETVVQTTLDSVQESGIIGGHITLQTAPATHLALPRIISGLRARGYQFVKTTDIIRAIHKERARV